MMVYQKNAISVIVILLHSGEVYRRNIKENDINNAILFRAGQSSLDSLPTLVLPQRNNILNLKRTI
jgi:hypothetical protein